MAYLCESKLMKNSCQNNFCPTFHPFLQVITCSFFCDEDFQKVFLNVPHLLQVGLIGVTEKDLFLILTQSQPQYTITCKKKIQPVIFVENHNVSFKKNFKYWSKLPFFESIIDATYTLDYCTLVRRLLKRCTLLLNN